LAERVRAVIGEDPLAGHLFLFRFRRGDRLKSLVWDRDGIVLWYKRLEAGVFKLPRVADGQRSVELRASALAMPLDGIDMAKLKRVVRYKRNVKRMKRVSKKCGMHDMLLLFQELTIACRPQKHCSIFPLIRKR
jgi:transposase